MALERQQVNQQNVQMTINNFCLKTFTGINGPLASQQIRLAILH